MINLRAMNRFVIFLLISFFSFRAAAQNAMNAYSYSVSLDLVNVTEDKDRVRVTIITPAITGLKVKYILPEYIPGVYGKVDAGRFIHQFYAVDDKGFPLRVKKKGTNVIQINLKKGETLKKIEYWIDDTWDMERAKPKTPDDKFNYVTQMAGTNIDAGNNFVLNHAFVLGYLEGLANIPYYVSVTKPEEMEASSALRITHVSHSKDEYSASTYYELLDNPVMYCSPDTIGFQSGDLYFSISVFSENGKISAHQVRRLIGSQLTASANFLSGVTPQTYQLIFYFTTPFKTILNSNGGYGGLPHKHSAFYFLPELADEDELAEELSRVISDDIMHVLSPIDHQSFSGNSDLLQPQFNSQWWFTEGTGMYFGWLATVRDSFVSESDFIGAISSSIKLSLLVPAKPMVDKTMLATMMKTPLNKEAIRSKSMLLAFLLDIEITKATGGSMGLREVVLQLNENGPVSSDSIQKKIIAMTGPSIADFFAKYVNGTEELPLISDLDRIGWAYAPSSIDSVLTFGKFGLLYSDDKDAFVVHNCDTTNLFGLRDGDRILSVDGTIVGLLNFEDALSPVYSPYSDKEVTLRYIRDNQNLEVAARPRINVVQMDYLIKPDPAAGDDAYLLHLRIFYPMQN
ncbi:MAG TPA: hypothetical protein VL651_16225 [Bacteroidia bacterium]|nr:hypothetical protein [Bacteroidia bacterium]